MTMQDTTGGEYKNEVQEKQNMSTWAPNALWHLGCSWAETLFAFPGRKGRHDMHH